MDTLFLKIKIKKSDKIAEILRDRGVFFDVIADNLNISKDQLIEINDDNLAKSIRELKKYWSNDKS